MCSDWVSMEISIASSQQSVIEWSYGVEMIPEGSNGDMVIRDMMQ